MRPRGTVSAQDAEAIRQARMKLEAAEAEFRNVVLDVTTRSSVRETAKAAGLSSNTVQRWRQPK